MFRWLGTFLWVLTAAYLYFTLIDLFTAYYSEGSHEAIVVKALISGSYAWLFWLTVSFFVLSFVVMFGQFVTRHYSIPLIVIAGVLANIAAIGKRDVIIVPSQTHGTLLPYPPGAYTPTWVELAIILGLFGLGTLLYIVFTKVFPIMDVHVGSGEALPHDADAGKRWRDGAMRKRMFILTLMVGIILAVVGFSLTAPLGPTAGPIYSEPRVQFAPLMFLVGIIITLLSPVVYELFPDKREES